MVFQSFAPIIEYETAEIGCFTIPPRPAKITAYQVTDPTLFNQAPVVQHEPRYPPDKSLSSG